MKIHEIRDMGPFGTNCYILETDRKNAVLIDAPYSAKAIIERLERLGLSLKKILLTHGHCDHIEALGGLCERYGCEVYISAEDSAMLLDRDLCLAGYFGTPFSPFSGAKNIADGQEISLDDVRIKVIATPGHSAGSVCYRVENAMFTGDTLFDKSIGRTDLGGSYPQLIRSVARLVGGVDCAIYPGHGGSSTLREELEMNPYLQDLRSGL